jgi:hypothetical protein
MKPRCVIILHSNSKYIDVCLNFLQLLKKYWSDCPYKLVVSLTGEEYTFSEYETINNGMFCTLPEAIYNVEKIYDADFYCCFLGDALINERIDNKAFFSLLRDMKQDGINYCSLKAKKPFHHVKQYNGLCRYIHSSDRYSHNYGAFIISKSFCQQKLTQFNTDLDFEKYYLQLTEEIGNSFFFRHDIIVKNNFMNLNFAVIKGRWERFTLWKLKKKNPEITFANLRSTSFSESILLKARDFFDPYIPRWLRNKIGSNLS